MPNDIDPKSGMRLPVPRREDLDAAGQQTYDRATKPGATIMGLHGPAGIHLWCRGAPALNAHNKYLRFEAGITPHVREVTILATAREMDSQFEWSAHEPEALKEGVSKDTVEAIKHRRPTAGLDPTDALLIDFVRQLWREHKLSSELFTKLKDRFGPNMLIDLVLLSGNYAGTAVLLHAVDMQLHEGSKPLLPMP